MRGISFVLFFAFYATIANAQYTCPTAPNSANDTRCASTAFVQNIVYGSTAQGAACNAVRLVSDGSVNGTSTFTSLSNTFSSADIGKTIYIQSAGPTQGLSSAVVSAAGTGYLPGDTITLTGGTETTNAVVSVGQTKVVSATVAAGGSGGTAGTQTVTGTTGVGILFTASVTVSGGGTITAVLSISSGGSYTTNPTALATEPVVGAGLTGAQLNVVMGVSSLGIPTQGVYTVTPSNPVSQGSTSGAGSGLTVTAGFGFYDLLTTITAISGKTATLAIAASTTASSLTWSYGTLDNTAITNLTTAGGGSTPNGYCQTSLSDTVLSANYFGRGQIITSSGGMGADNVRGPYLAELNAAPSHLGNDGSVVTAFNGDLSKTPLAIERRVTGTATLTQPSSGYIETPEAASLYTYYYNSSGWNNSTSGNGGRTLASSLFLQAFQVGQGDLATITSNCFVTGAKSGATAYLANPACEFATGQMTAGQSGVYLDNDEFSLVDNGYDVAGAGSVRNLSRTATTGTLFSWWFGYRVQSKSAGAVDVAYSATGNIDIDFQCDQTTLTSGASSGIYTTGNACLTMKADQKIYGNANGSDASGISRYSSSIGTSYFSWSSSLSAWTFVSNGNASFELYSSQALAPIQLVAFTNFLVGGNTGFTGATGEVGLAKIAASASAPGANWLKFEAVCGTNAGSAKIITYAGTSSTPVTVIDNVGSGVTGC